MSDDTIHVLGIAGSLRRGSYNRLLVRAAQRLAPAGLVVHEFDLADVPLFDADGRLVDEGAERFLRQLLVNLAAWTRQVRGWAPPAS